MTELNRREFLIAASAAVVAPTWQAKPSIAFSTLGCPKWTWLQILDFAQVHGFDALELRGLEAQMDLSQRPEFSAGQIANTRKQLEQRNLRVVGLGASANMHEPDPAKREAQFTEARRFVDVAAALNTPYVRVFGNKYVEGEEKDVTIARIVGGMRELGEYAAPRSVQIVIESHGDFTDSPTLLRILDGVGMPNVGFLWDAHHTWVQSQEPPDVTVRTLGKYIRHTHLKDSVPDGKGGRRYVLTGAGEVPVRRQVELLQASGYTGAYCFEWEKRWHPEIEEPDVAIPHYAKVVREYLRRG